MCDTSVHESVPSFTLWAPVTHLTARAPRGRSGESGGIAEVRAGSRLLRGDDCERRTGTGLVDVSQQVHAAVCGGSSAPGGKHFIKHFPE